MLRCKSTIAGKMYKCLHFYLGQSPWGENLCQVPMTDAWMVLEAQTLHFVTFNWCFEMYLPNKRRKVGEQVTKRAMIGSCCQLKTGFQLSDAHLSITGSQNHILLLSLVKIFYFTDNDLDKKRSKHTESTSEWQGHVLPCVSLKFLGNFHGSYLTCVPFYF